MSNLDHGKHSVKPEGKCFGYVRMSTSKQEDSPEVQAKILGEWAADLGIEIKLLFEIATSAFTQDFEKRPVGKMLARKLRRGDWLVATRIDRVLRGRTSWYIIDRLRRRGVKVIFVSEGIVDPEGPDGVFHETIVGAIAERESRMLSVRIREAFAWRREQGLPTNGRSDYGHKIVHVTKELDSGKRTIFVPRTTGLHDPITGKTLDESIGEADLHWIARAAQLRMTHRATCQYIADWLNSLGVRSPYWSRIKKCYLPWSRMRVSRATNWFWKVNNIRPPKHAHCQRRWRKKWEPLTSVSDSPAFTNEFGSPYTCKCYHCGAALTEAEAEAKCCPRCGTHAGGFSKEREPPISSETDGSLLVPSGESEPEG